MALRCFVWCSKARWQWIGEPSGWFQTAGDPVGDGAKVLPIAVAAGPLPSQLEFAVEALHYRAGGPVMIVVEDAVPMPLERRAESLDRFEATATAPRVDGLEVLRSGLAGSVAPSVGEELPPTERPPQLRILAAESLPLLALRRVEPVLVAPQ